MGGAGLLLWIYLLRRHTPGTISVFSFMTPVSGLFLSAFFFDEQLTARLATGIAVILTGIFLVTRSGRVLPVSEPRS